MIDTKRWLNIPFKWGGEDFDGADCSGIVRLFLKEECGLVLPKDFVPHTARTVETMGESIMVHFLDTFCKRVSHPQFGSIVVIHFYKENAHLGVMLDSGSFLHTIVGANSLIGNLSTYGSHRIVGYWRGVK